MYTFIVHGRVEDGSLHIDAPMSVDIPDGEHDVVIAIASLPNPAPLTTWPEGFFDDTYGALADDPIERPDQGVVEVRAPLG